MRIIRLRSERKTRAKMIIVLWILVMSYALYCDRNLRSYLLEQSIFQNRTGYQRFYHWTSSNIWSFVLYNSLVWAAVITVWRYWECRECRVATPHFLPPSHHLTDNLLANPGLTVVDGEVGENNNLVMNNVFISCQSEVTDFIRSPTGPRSKWFWRNVFQTLESDFLYRR